MMLLRVCRQQDPDGGDVVEQAAEYKMCVCVCVSLCECRSDLLAIK